MNLTEFRDQFAALESYAWLDTPGAPPGATPVLAALRQVLDASENGTGHWLDWDQLADSARRQFSAWTGVDPSLVATIGSLAEAAATVARFREPGPALLFKDEFQSLLFPFLSEAEADPQKPVGLVERSPGISRTETLIEKIRPGISLVAVSETTTADGERLDLNEIRRHTRSVGAQLFVNGTQSLGALNTDLTALSPDYYAVHGYKWMLAPRGAAWLYASHRASEPLRSIAPSWKTPNSAAGLFGGHTNVPSGMERCDTSQAWWSWAGADAALQLLAEISPRAVEAHVLALAEHFELEAIALGARSVRTGPGSHIRVVTIDNPEIARQALHAAKVTAKITGDQLRIGVHGFNNTSDIERALGAVHAAQAQR